MFYIVVVVVGNAYTKCPKLPDLFGDISLTKASFQRHLKEKCIS